LLDVVFNVNTTFEVPFRRADSKISEIAEGIGRRRTADEANAIAHLLMRLETNVT
jgi:hypothetical protein